MKGEGIVAICGLSGAGKDALFTLVKQMGFDPVVSYTTRPPRDHEIEGVHYHFIDDDKFEELKSNSFFAEWTEYNTKFGIWKYAMPKTECKLNKIAIMNPQGIEQLDRLYENVLVVYVDASEKIRLKRLEDRKDSKEEVQRREEEDAVKFVGAIDRADFIFSNNLDDYEYFKSNVNDFVELELKPYIESITDGEISW